MRLDEIFNGDEPLKKLMDIYKQEVLSSDVPYFDDFWGGFIHNYLNDANKKMLLDYVGEDSIEDVQPYHYNHLPLQAKKMFTDWAIDDGIIRYITNDDITSMPTWYNTTLKSNIKHGWLIHFSDHTSKIMKNGFLYGVENPNAISKTFTISPFGGRNMNDSVQTKGYNFGYPIDDVDLESKAARAISDDFYGKSAVLFKAPHLLIEHHDDNEVQAVFWGDSARNLIQINHDGNSFVSNNHKDEKFVNLIRRLI